MEAEKSSPAQADKPAVPRPADEPESFKKAADGEELTPVEEAEALDWLMELGDPYEYDVPVDITTPEGKQRITWTVKALDNATFRSIEKEVIDKMTDPQPFDVAVKTVVKATVRPDLKDVKFRGGMADPEMALASRFKFQSGILLALTDRIREISGYDDLAVGQATQRQAQAVKNS